VGRYRDDLSERQIRYDLLHGMSVTQAAIKYGCSISLICRIRDDKRAAKLADADVCECCGVRPKFKDNRFLCEVCYRGLEDDIDELEHVNHYRLPECSSWDDLFNP